MNGKLSIGRTQANVTKRFVGRHGGTEIVCDEWISIEVQLGVKPLRRIVITLPLEVFAACLTGSGLAPCNVELRGLKP